MQRAYIEPSVINRVADLNLPADCVRDFVAFHGFQPTTGLHTVYELARSFLGGDAASTARARRLFAILRDLDPSYQPEPGDLLQGEVEKLRRHVPGMSLLEPWKIAATRKEVARLAEGPIDEQARWFIAAKEREKERELEAEANHLVLVRSFRSADRSIRGLKTFDQVVSYFESRGEIPLSIREILGGAVSLHEAEELAALPSSFPAISAAVRANAYVNFIMTSQGVRPGRDKLDDYKHCFEASYCDAFITADGQQQTAMKAICPAIPVFNWNKHCGTSANMAPS
jgi:hypothetical protein